MAGRKKAAKKTTTRKAITKNSPPLDHAFTLLFRAIALLRQHKIGVQVIARTGNQSAPAEDAEEPRAVRDEGDIRILGRILGPNGKTY